MSHTPHVLFISDLHLSEETPATTALFKKFIQEHACHADALYILGDFFEYWAGDDDVESPYHQEIIQLLTTLKNSQTKLFFQHGNRDLLLGNEFMQLCHATLLPDPTLIELFGQPILLSHGDALCTDDVQYQQFRNLVRNPAYQQQFLQKPLAERKAFIKQLRQQSMQQTQSKTEEIMDVSLTAVGSLLREHHYASLIHGHTHRPMCHQHEIDGQLCQRWVLADWHEDRGGALYADATEFKFLTL